MKNPYIKKTAESIMTQFVMEFSSECNPKNYKYSPDYFEDDVRKKRNSALDSIHSVILLMISIGLAKPREYDRYADQIEALEKLYLAEFKSKKHAA